MATVWVALAGAVGAVTRYRIGVAVGVRSFPWATLGINIVGCFVLAVLAAGPATRWSPTVSVALTVGFLGAFTTFSTFGYETVTLLRTDRPGLAALYVAASLVGGLGASAGGYLLGRS
ncbi:MAG: fluoride efflux transporter CrcB [Acidimicrobiales bacterium]